MGQVLTLPAHRAIMGILLFSGGDGALDISGGRALAPPNFFKSYKILI